MLYRHRSRIQQDHIFQQSRPPISSEQDAHVAARTEHQQHQQLQYTKHTNRQPTIHLPFLTIICVRNSLPFPSRMQLV
jgi:hypothetical protein